VIVSTGLTVSDPLLPLSNSSKSGFSPDAQRFLFWKPAGPADAEALAQIVVVTNWTEELSRRVPTK